MAYNRPVSDGGHLIEFQDNINFTGNAANTNGALQLTTHTDGLYSVDLLEIGYGTTGETTLDSSLPTLIWTNGDLRNDKGTSNRPLVMLSTPVPIYYNEYNLPINLYKFDGANHRSGSQVFSLQLLKPNGTPMNTTFVRMRFRCRYHQYGEMVYDPDMLSKVLNAPT